MATINGFIRSYGAAVRRSERQQQREARELAKRFREQQKREEIHNAHQAVSDWENYVRTLQSVHKNCTDPIDWKKIRNTAKPREPKPENTNELIAQNKLDSYRPSILDKIFRSTERKKFVLKLQVDQARAKDAKENDIKYNEFKDELNDWEELQRISDGIEKNCLNRTKMLCNTSILFLTSEN